MGTLLGMVLMFGLLAFPLSGVMNDNPAIAFNEGVNEPRDTSPPAENTFLDQAIRSETEATQTDP